MMASILLKVLWKLYYESHIVLYCAMQAVPALDPTAHLAFASPEACLKQATVSNSFGELHCVCRREPKPDHRSFIDQKPTPRWPKSSD
jgi:hypothetical protein